MSAHESSTANRAPKGKEIERKFLVRYIPDWLDEHPSRKIVQGYAAIEESGTEVRLRKEGEDKYTLTIKSKGDLVRGEHETPLMREQFDALWPTTEGRRLEKMRTTVLEGEHTIEVDRYLGKLAGRMVVEVEFPTKQEAEAFVPPQWFGEDVTALQGLKNQQLALYGWPEAL